MSNAFSWIIDVSQSAFEAEVIERSRQVPVVVDFWAPWCQPCRLLGPMLEQQARARAGAFILAKVDIDHAPELAARFGIEAIPAVKAFRDGESVLGFVGLVSPQELGELIDRILPTQSDRLAREAEDAEARNPADAERLFRQALEQNRNQPSALLGLARLLIGRGGDAEAASLLDRVGEGGEHGAERERLQAMLSLRQHAAELGGEATLRQRLGAEPESALRLYQLGCAVAGAGRYQEALDLLLKAAQRDRALASREVKDTMVRIFHIVGVRSPLADEYRDRLTRLLY